MLRHTYSPKKSLYVLLGSACVAGALTISTPALAEESAAKEDAKPTPNTQEQTAPAIDAPAHSVAAALENVVHSDAEAVDEAATEDDRAVSADDTANSSETTGDTEVSKDSAAEEDAIAADNSKDEADAIAEDADKDKTEDTAEDKVQDQSAKDVIIRSKMSDTKVVDIQGAQNKAGDKVGIWEYNGGANQHFDIVQDENNKEYYYIQVKGTNKVLDIEYANIKAGTRVILWDKKASDNQLWKLDTKDGFVRFLSKANAALALNIQYAQVKDGSSLIIWNAVGADNEWFKLMAAKPEVAKGAAVDEGLYSLSAKEADGNFVLSDASGTVGLAKAGASLGERISISQADDGFYYLTFTTSGNNLAVDGGKIVATTSVVQSPRARDFAQMWAFKKLDNGGYVLINRASGLALDVFGRNISQTGKLNGYYETDAYNQQFFLQRIASLADAASADIKEGSYIFVSTQDELATLGMQKDGSMGVKRNYSPSTSNISIKKQADGYYSLHIAGSMDKTLDITYNSKKNGAKLGTYKFNGNDNQLWKIIEKNGAYLLASKGRPDFVIDLFGASVADANPAILWSATGGKNQLFKLISTTDVLDVAPSAEIADASYIVHFGSKNSKVVLDVPGYSTADRATLATWTQTSGQNQKFYMRKVGDYYKLVSLSSGKYIATDASRAPQKVFQQSESSKDSQLWSLEAAAGGAYRLRNKANGLYLNLANRNIATDTLVYAGLSTNKDSLIFLEKCAVVSDGLYTISDASLNNLTFDINGASASDGGKLIVWNKTQGQNQIFQLVYDTESDSYRIRTGASGGYLEDAGTNIVQKGKSNSPKSDNNSWKLVWGKGGFALQNLASNNFLSLGGKAAQGTDLVGLSSLDKALSRLVFSGASLIHEGIYSIVQSATNKVLDLTGAAYTQGTNVGVWTDNSAWNQKFYIKGTDSKFNIYSVVGNVCLDVQGASKAEGANVALWSPNDGSNQQWRAEIADGGGIRFVNLNSGLALATNGSNVVQSKTQATTATWNLKATNFSLNDIAKIGWQNPSWMYQVSSFKSNPKLGGGFWYVSPNKIKADATREQVVEAFIATAMSYLGTPYRWDYAAAPGVGVDCAGLVLQAMYSVGINSNYYSPYNHYYTPGHDHYANDMRRDEKIPKVSLANRRRGDLIFWPGHVAIYLGGDRIVEADVPRVRTNNLWYRGTPIAVGRLFW